MRTVVLVRHASAGKRSAWCGTSDRDRPLDDRGRDQARLVADALLADGTVSILVSSPFVRCVETLEPLGAAIGLPIATDEALAEAPDRPPLPGAVDPWLASAWAAGRASALLDRTLHALPDGGRAVACSHGDVLPALLAHLAARDEVLLEGVHLRKGGFAALRFDGDGRCTAAALTPPPDEEPGR